MKQAGLKAAVATSGGAARTRGTLRDMGLAEYFDAVVTGDEVMVGKPDPSIYRLAAERLGEDPCDLLAIEDAASGVQAATGAGMRCVGIAADGRADKLRAVGARPVVPNFRSLSLADLNQL